MPRECRRVVKVRVANRPQCFWWFNNDDDEDDEVVETQRIGFNSVQNPQEMRIHIELTLHTALKLHKMILFSYVHH